MERNELYDFAHDTLLGQYRHEEKKEQSGVGKEQCRDRKMSQALNPMEKDGDDDEES